MAVDWLQWGYAGLFVASFLAATLIPMGSEWLVAAMVVAGFDPGGVLAWATAGNTLGALATYGCGRLGGYLIRTKQHAVLLKPQAVAQQRLARWGPTFLVWSWVPVLGDPLALAAGVLKLPVVPCTVWILAGKWVRYFAVIQAALVAGNI